MSGSLKVSLHSLVRDIFWYYYPDDHQSSLTLFILALKLHGKDWKKVEDYIGTRTGAQIRSHAQKYFHRIEQELNCSGLAFPSSHNGDSQDDLEEGEGEDEQLFDEESNSFLAVASKDGDNLPLNSGMAGKVSVDSQKSIIQKFTLESTSSKDCILSTQRGLAPQSLESQVVQGFMLDTNKHHITKEPVPESKAQQLVPEDVILPRNA